MKTQELYLPGLGVYGFDAVEPVILAALVTEDPLLLVGQSGTAKTFLLNSLSEALDLEHRHYNASLIAFDDLVGFPYPDKGKSGIRYLETPATVWKAESVLVDEISRCRPEHQNRFFSLIHERRLQGIQLERLRYRWAAMNPPAIEQNGEGGYSGCEALDTALADRFAFVVSVNDWDRLTEADQRRVADPRGDGAISNDDGRLQRFVSIARARFLQSVRNPCPQVVDYSRVVTTALGEVGIRISPRRARQLARNILALQSVSALDREQLFLLALRWSLPQRATGRAPADEIIHAAHRTAWDLVCATGSRKWLLTFHQTRSLPDKLRALLSSCPDPDTGTLAVTQLLANESKCRVCVFAFALYPLALTDADLPLGAEGINELGRIVNPMLHVEGTRRWFDPKVGPAVRGTAPRLVTTHQLYHCYAAVCQSLSGARRERAEQLFAHLFLKCIKIDDPAQLEEELNQCIEVIREHVSTRQKPDDNPRPGKTRKPRKSTRRKSTR